MPARAPVARWFRALGAAFVLAIALVPAAHAADANPNWAVLQKYCFGCHNTDDWAGGLAFETLSPDNPHADAAAWEATIRKMRGRLMPPPGKDRPTAAEARGIVNWLETSLDASAAVK